MVLKIIPIDDGSFSPAENIPWKSRAKDVLHELLITQTLSPREDPSKFVWNGFVKLFGAALVRGSYPSLLLQSWEKFDKESKSENISPENFPSSQHFVILLLEYGGDDLEHIEITTAEQCLSLFRQVSTALYRAQQV